MKDKNVLFFVIDSCRYDTFKEAKMPFIKSIGKLRKAQSHGSYTVPSHVAFFSGHLPIVLDGEKEAYYSEAIRQLWRIQTGRNCSHKEVGLDLKGNNILDGFRKLGYKVLGVGGVSQFADESLLRSFFDEDFLYFGKNIDEEPLSPRASEEFPLNHISTIIDKIKNEEKWFLFINSPETHYPYDFGDGIPKSIQDQFQNLQKHLNLRESSSEILNDSELSINLKRMQINSLEKIDLKFQKLIESIPKNRDILVLVCADHGESFGEMYAHKKRWGHMFPSEEVLSVPLIIGEIHVNK